MGKGFINRRMEMEMLAGKIKIVVDSLCFFSVNFFSKNLPYNQNVLLSMEQLYVNVSF